MYVVFSDWLSLSKFAFKFHVFLWLDSSFLFNIKSSGYVIGNPFTFCRTLPQFF